MVVWGVGSKQLLSHLVTRRQDIRSKSYSSYTAEEADSTRECEQPTSDTEVIHSTVIENSNYKEMHRSLEVEMLESKLKKLDKEIQQKNYQIDALEHQAPSLKLNSSITSSIIPSTPSMSTSTLESQQASIGFSDILKNLHSGFEAKLVAQSNALAQDREQDLENLKRMLSFTPPSTR